MDRFGIDHFATFKQRSDLVAEMCRRGYADRMVLSHDCSCYLDWFAQGALAALKDWHYLHVSQDVVPYLRDHGVTEPNSTRCSSAPPPASSPANREKRAAAPDPAPGAAEIQVRSSERVRSVAACPAGSRNRAATGRHRSLRAIRPDSSVRLAEQVVGDPGQVHPHGLHGGGRVADPQRGHDLPVVGLVLLPALARRCAA